MVKLKILYVSEQEYYIFRHLSDTDLLSYLIHHGHTQQKIAAEEGKYYPVKCYFLIDDKSKREAVLSRLEKLQLRRIFQTNSHRERMLEIIQDNVHYERKTTKELKEELE